MANKCEITSGRGLSCKDALGGITAIYLFNAGTAVFTLDPETDMVTSIDDGAGNPADAYKYELKGTGNNLTQNINSDRNTGTTFFEQVLSITLKKLTARTNKEVKLLAWGNPTIVVADNQGNSWLVGRAFGADLTGGTAVTGDAFADLSGYTMTFTGNERMLANALTGSIEGNPFADTALEVNVIEANVFEIYDSVGSITGSYTVGTPLTATEKFTVKVDVKKLGYYNLSTNVTNGFGFKATGTFLALGPSTVDLLGYGNPLASRASGSEDIYTAAGSGTGSATAKTVVS